MLTLRCGLLSGSGHGPPAAAAAPAPGAGLPPSPPLRSAELWAAAPGPPALAAGRLPCGAPWAGPGLDSRPTRGRGVVAPGGW